MSLVCTPPAREEPLRGRLEPPYRLSEFGVSLLAVMPAEPDHSDLEAYAYGAKGEPQQHLYVVDSIIPGLALLILGVTWWRRKARQRDAEQAEEQAGDPTLEPGLRVLVGTVREIDAGDAAVRVRIVQYGKERRGKSSYTTTWTEVQRQVETSAFQLELANGASVRVEPGPAPKLVDELSGWTRTDLTERVAVSELRVGERVYASGQLLLVRDPAGAYRGGESWVLRPPPGQSMLLSTRGLARPWREGKARAAQRARWVVVVALLAQLCALPYYVAVFAGAPAKATIVDRQFVPAAPKKMQSCRVRYRVETSGKTHEDEVSCEKYQRLQLGTTVPVHVTPLETTLGPHPTAHGAFFLFPSGAMLVVAVWAVVSTLGRREWHQRKLVHEVPGRL